MRLKEPEDTNVELLASVETNLAVRMNSLHNGFLIFLFKHNQINNKLPVKSTTRWFMPAKGTVIHIYSLSEHWETAKLTQRHQTAEVS